MNLNQVDLNLLLLLKQLLQEKHVTNTALTLNMSQSSVSRALHKLRKLFSDPLLVKSSNGYALTPKAETIKRDLNTVLTSLEKLIDGNEFFPSSSDKTIRIFGLAPQMDILLPKLVNILRDRAPQMTLDVDTVSKPHFTGLISGAHHFIITNQEPPAADQDLYRQHYLDRDFRLIMSANHPLADAPLDAEKLRNCQFGQVSLQGDKKLSIEPRFKALGITGDNGKIATPVRLNNFSSAASIAANSDIIFHLPTDYALQAAKSHNIVCREVPTNLQHPTKRLYLYWHKRYHQDPMCVWFRSIITEISNLENKYL